MIFAIAAILLVTGLALGANGLLYTPLWKVTINSELSSFKDDFSLGVGKPATDSYDINDILKAPLFPGKSIRIQSVIDGKALQEDYRANLWILKSKSWQTTLILNDPSFTGISGTEILTWKLERVPRNIKVMLIDYGKDLTRKNIVKNVDMKKNNSYSFNITNSIGSYRYIDIKVSKRI